MKKKTNTVEEAEAKATKFKGAKTPIQYEGLSVTTLLGEKEPLMEALNKCNHDYNSFAQLVRASINMMLKDLGSNFQLTEK